MVKSLISGLLMLTVTISGSVEAADIPAGAVPGDRQELVRQVTSLPVILDPLQQNHPEESPWLQDLFEGLTIVDQQGNIIPGIAVNWSSNDNQHWIFTLRKNARWSDGSPVTAGDFVYSWQRLALPETVASYKNFLQQSGVKNAPEVIRGELAPQALGITAIDDTHLKITLVRPLAYFPVMTTHPAFYPQKTRYQAGESPAIRQAQLFNGAWQLNSLHPSQSITLIPNPYYYNAEQTVLKKVTYVEINNTPEVINRYQQGNVQLSAPLKPHQYAEEFPGQVVSSPRLSRWLLVFDRAGGPTSDVRVRKALSWSIDRQMIAANILQNRAIAGWQMTPGGTGNYAPQLLSAEQHTVQERMALAKSLLLSAGYGPTRPLNLTVSYRQAGDEPQVVRAIAAMWQQQLHVQVTLKPQASDQPHSSEADVTTEIIDAEFNHPAAFLNSLTSGHPQNISKFNDTEYDSLILRAERESSEQLRNQDYNQAEHLIADKVPVAPVFQYVTRMLIAPEVQGYPQKKPQGYSYSRELWIEQQAE